MIQGTIQWYEDMIRESGAPAFDPIYPHIIKLLQSCECLLLPMITYFLNVLYMMTTSLHFDLGYSV